MQEKDFINAQDFILACKMDWTKSKYSSLRERFFEKQSNSDAILSVSDVEKLFEDDLDYQIFGWFERYFCCHICLGINDCLLKADVTLPFGCQCFVNGFFKRKSHQ